MSELQIIEKAGIEVFSAQERAVIDSQIATAKQYPRDLMRVKNSSIAIVTMDKKFAECCRFTKPVAGKNITGASVHLARVIAQQYGNIRVQQRIREIGERVIIAEAVAHDLETNYAVSVEARRSIIGRDGKRFAESVIETSAMAILAIAERNAILKVIPRSITDAAYDAAFQMVNGNLSDEVELQRAKKKALEYFATKYGATEGEILAALGLKSTNQIDSEQVANMRGFIQALKDNEITPDELFKRKKDVAAIDPFVAESKVDEKSEQPKKQTGKINFEQ